MQATGIRSQALIRISQFIIHNSKFIIIVIFALLLNHCLILNNGVMGNP